MSVLVSSLRMWRKEAGKTQSEVAEAMGLRGSQLVSNIERGTSKLPRCHWPAVARVLGKSIEDIKRAYFTDLEREIDEQFGIAKRTGELLAP